MRHLLGAAPSLPRLDFPETDSPELGEAQDCHVISSLSGRRERGDFEDYFRRNWDSYVGMWCSYTHQSAVTLGNNTSNRLEASWKQLKDVVHGFTNVAECAESIIFFQTLSEKDYVARLHKISIVRNSTYGRDVSAAAQLLSEHVCTLAYREYEFATTRARYTFHSAIPNLISITANSV
ncbi:hypothetical protein PybrP1_004806 [[Pythium] brassicae (nom. inval.)]|nr:hypothetical protein PybrP1_004806 [[Pythium] brassicae (nom. inval.)]